jgi:hypothetical protein
MSNPLAADVTISGTITANICGLESSMNANAGFHLKLFRIDKNGAATVVCDSESGSELGTALARQSWNITPTSTAMKKGDRFLLVVMANDAGGTMGSGFTVTCRYNGDSTNTADSNITFTETVTFNTTTPAGSTYYLRNTAHGSISGGRMLSTTIGAAAATAVHTTVAGPATFPGSQWTDTAGGSAVSWYTPPLNAFTLSDLVFIKVQAGQAWESGGISSPFDTCIAEIAVCDADGTNAVIFGTTYQQAQQAANGGFFVQGGDLSVAQGQIIRFRFYQMDGNSDSVSGTNRTINYNDSAANNKDVLLQFTQTITESSGGSANVTPGIGVLDLTGIAPTIQTPRNLVPGVGDLQLTGVAPTVVIGKQVFPGVGDLQVTGLAPTVQTPRNLQPGVGALTLTGLNPTVQTPKNIQAGLGDLQLTGLAPTVQTPRSIQPGVGVLDLTGLAPTVQTPRSIQTGVGALTLTGFAPTVSGGTGAPTNVTPGVGALDLTGLAPTVQTPRAVTPGVGSLQVAGLAPTVQTPRSIQTGVGSLTLTGFAPTINVSVSVTPGVGQLTLASFAPVVNVGMSVTPGVGDLLLSGLAPTMNVSANVFVRPGVGQLVLQGLNPFLVISGIASVPTTGQIWPRGNW